MNSHLVSVAVFDNAQVRHAFNPKPAKLVFEQQPFISPQRPSVQRPAVSSIQVHSLSLKAERRRMRAFFSTLTK